MSDSIQLRHLQGAKTDPSTVLALWDKFEMLLPSLNKTDAPNNGPNSTNAPNNWNSGIIADLGDLEPRAQEYPITINFLKTLNEILEQIAQYSMLQSPQLQQSVSLETCLNLVTNIVFLRVNSRQFNKIEEKWTILTLCIKAYNIFLSRYDPAEDGNSHRCSFNLLSQILQDGEVFKCIMWNIEDAVNNLENSLITSSNPESNTTNASSDQQQSNYTPDPLLDEFLQVALTLINCAAEKQEPFMDLIRQIPGYPTVSNVKINVLMNGVNPKTKSVDKLATIIRVPAVASTKTTVQALVLLEKVTSSQHDIAEHISLHLNSSNSPLVHGDNLITLFVNCLSSDSKEVRTAALKFISTCLEHKVGRQSYNVAHVLLGFDSQMTTLREPGAAGKVFDCLHAIINFFDNQEAFSHPELDEERRLGLEITYKLCVDLRTCDLTFRFLRSSYDFLSKYLKNLFKLFSTETTSYVLETRLDEIIWFMKLLAVEIKLSRERNVKSIATNHLNLLLSEKPRKLLELLPNSMCGHTHPPMPNWECFDNDELWTIIAERADGKAIIDLKDLYRKLSSEVKLINIHLGSTQKNLIRDEITEVLDFASNLNQSYRLQAKKYEYVNAWRELTETIIAVNALDCFDNDLAVRILFELVHELMSKTSIPNFMICLFTQISSAILMAAASLRQIGSKPTTTTNFLSTARSIQNLLEQTSSLLSQHKRARVNLYAAFLYASKALPETVSNDLKFNRSLLEKIYKDVLLGPEVAKVLALTILTQSDLSWVEGATKNGSLRHLVESLVEDDLEIVATKGEVITKAFYSFESKVTLFTRIASTLQGAKSLVHLNIMEVLGSLRCIDSYLMLLDENTFFQKLYLDVLQLMSTLSTSMRINNKNLLKVKPLLHTEILRNVSLLKNRADGLETLLATTSLQSQIILEADSRLRRDFVNSIQHFTTDLSDERLKILVNLLTGCVKILRSEQSSPTPLFAPSWNATSTPVLMSQPSLGTLISILNNLHYQNQVQTDEQFREVVTENCLHLIWCHMNIYLDSNYKTKSIRELESFKNEYQVVLNDAFLNKLAFSRSEFVKIISRKLKRLRMSIM